MEYIADRSYVGPQNYSIQGESMANPSPLFVSLLSGGSENDAGIALTHETALGNPAVWTSASKICGHIAQMPLDCMRWVNRKEEESEADGKHPAHYILNYQFNEYTSADVGKETLQLHATMRGNGRALIVRNARYEASELVILNPEETFTVGVSDDEGSPVRSKWHVWRDPKTGKMYPFPDRDVFHLCGLSNDGFSGFDTIVTAANAISLGIVAERKSARFLKNDSVPSMLLEAPVGSFTKAEDAQQYLNDFRRAHSGDKAGTVGMLRGGVKANVISAKANESQMIEQRKFSREDMALLFGVEQMLGIDKSVSYNSEEQRSKAYRVNTLGRWMTRWSQEARRKLLSEQQKRSDSHFFMWNDEILLQATLAERMEAYGKGIANKIFNPNEVRKKEGYRPYKGGDVYENPNVGRGNATATAPEPQPNQAAKVTRQAANVIRSNIEHIVGIEAKRLDKLSHHKQAVNKICDFYDGWKATMQRVLVEYGGTEGMGEEWVEKSKEQILAVSDTATEETFPELVKQKVESWSDRIEQIVNRILGVE